MLNSIECRLRTLAFAKRLTKSLFVPNEEPRQESEAYAGRFSGKFLVQSHRIENVGNVHVGAKNKSTIRISVGMLKEIPRSSNDFPHYLLKVRINIRDGLFHESPHAPLRSEILQYAPSRIGQCVN